MNVVLEFQLRWKSWRLLVKAIVKTKREPGIEVLDVPEPEITDTDILVKVKAASVCGSDVHVYEWTPNYEWISIPVILGHEFSGEVVKTGAKVKTIKSGDRITAMPGMACSRCDFCQVGRPDLCSDRKSLGLRGDGAFAEYIRLTAATSVFKLPDSLSYEAASLTEPLSVVLRAVDLALFRVGQTAAVLVRVQSDCLPSSLCVSAAPACSWSLEPGLT